MREGLPDGFEDIGVDVLRRILDGVPSRSEAAGTFAIVGNDVDTGYACNLVYVDVVVGDVAAIVEGEELALAELTCQLPDAVHDGLCELHTDAFTREGGTATAHHIEQDAIACFVAVGFGSPCPELGTKTPCVG